MDKMYEITSPPGDFDAAKKFNTLLITMIEKKTFAIARYVRIDNADPKLGVLIPNAKNHKRVAYFCHVIFTS